MNSRLTICALAAIFAALVVCSCSARMTGRLNPDASGTIQLETALEPNMTTLLRSMGNLGGSTGNAARVLDAAAFAENLRAAPGVASANLRNSGREKIDGTIAFSRVNELLAAGGNRFISYLPPAASAPGRLGIRLDRSGAPKLLSLISPEAADYLSALMAPAATGEALTRTEYLELVGSVYGKNIAAEIAASVLRITLSFPGIVASAKGGTFSGREARFETPLLDILVLEQPLDYEIIWRGP